MAYLSLFSGWMKSRFCSRCYFRFTKRKRLSPSPNSQPDIFSKQFPRIVITASAPRLAACATLSCLFLPHYTKWPFSVRIQLEVYALTFCFLKFKQLHEVGLLYLFRLALFVGFNCSSCFSISLGLMSVPFLYCCGWTTIYRTKLVSPDLINSGVLQGAVLSFYSFTTNLYFVYLGVRMMYSVSQISHLSKFAWYSKVFLLVWSLPKCFESPLVCSRLLFRSEHSISDPIPAPVLRAKCVKYLDATMHTNLRRSCGIYVCIIPNSQTDSVWHKANCQHFFPVPICSLSVSLHLSS